ncbi:hypothetical protein [Flavobacterium covae]|uniref:hypothetical protein n=1 Tax=Flavobacterium covae TaxID=2906076 RepID=UPI0035E45612
MKFTLLILVLLFLLRPVEPMVSYIINYDYISNVLCENNDKPELKCNGKCYLQKQMAKIAEEEKPLQKDTKQVKLEHETLFLYPVLESLIPIKIFNFQKNHFVYTNLYNFLKENLIFHPPSLF